MTAIDYAELANDVQVALADFGRDVIYRRSIVTANEVDPSLPNETKEDVTVRVLFLTPKREGRESLVNRENEQRKINKRLYLGAQTFEPGGKDTFIVDGDEFRIRSIKETNPAGIVIYYEIEIER